MEIFIYHWIVIVNTSYYVSKKNKPKGHNYY